MKPWEALFSGEHACHPCVGATLIFSVSSHFSVCAAEASTLWNVHAEFLLLLPLHSTPACEAKVLPTSCLDSYVSCIWFALKTPNSCSLLSALSTAQRGKLGVARGGGKPAEDATSGAMLSRSLPAKCLPFLSHSPWAKAACSLQTRFPLSENSPL